MAAKRKARHIKDLVPDPRNARKHSPRNVGTIVDALHEVGAARSIVIDEDGVILAGNATIEAAAEAGITKLKIVDANGSEIVAVRRSGLDANQKAKLALYDNRAAELADGWDTSVLDELRNEGVDLSGLWWDGELEALDPETFGTGEVTEDDPSELVDRSEELQKEWKTEAGQLWKLGDHRLLCGDSTKAEDVARVLDGAVPILMVTDPPYGVEYDPEWRNEAAREGKIQYGATRTGKVTNDDLVDWSAAWSLFSGDIAYVWCASWFLPEVAESLNAHRFERRSLIIWRKPYAPISRGHYHWQHEPCWYAVRKGATAKWKGDRKQTTVWDLTSPGSTTTHGTQKPLECMARPMRNHDAPEVYEPFSGSGTTIVAAEQLDRRCYAIEIAPNYVAVSLQRWADLTGKTPELVKG